MDNENTSIDKNELQQLLLPNGVLHKGIENFEFRQGQIDLCSDIIEAFNNNTHLISEAGTGIGKSLAYLLPSIYYKGGKVLISTNTKTLQDQLFEKDIPLIQKHIDRKVNIVIAKGKGNYLCKKKIADFMNNLSDFTNEEIDCLTYLKIKGGEEQDYPEIPGELWNKICVNDICSGKKCTFYKECFYYEKRKLLDSANIIICNHHLLACDLAARILTANFNGRLVLPVCTKLIIDEAHNFEDVLVKNLTKSFSKKGIHAAIKKCHSESGKGLLDKLIINLSNFKLSCRDDELLQNIHSLIAYIKQYYQEDLLAPVYSYVKNLDKTNEVRFRVKPSIGASTRWQNCVGTYIQDTANVLINIGLKFELVTSLITGVINEEDENSLLLLLELNRLSESISKMGSLSETFNNPTLDHDIRWVETYKNNIKFNISPVDIAGILRESIYPHISSVIYTSATLTFDNSFSHINKRLGLSFLEQDRYSSKQYPSPFNYKENSMILIPEINQTPNDRDFIKTIAPWVEEISLHLQGKTFILFTSFYQLDQCYNMVQGTLKKAGITCLSQSKEHKNTIISKFKSCKKAVLFGTSTFWEGVDIKGEKLQCVIIPRVPFQVPTDPLVEARMEVLEQQGGNSFMDFMLPEAVIKLKQGFGRLIRSTTDTGSVWFLDNRIYKKSYGAKFIKSLPPAKMIASSYQTCISQFKDFYK